MLANALRRLTVRARAYADAIALNKKELASRTPTTHYERFVTNMGKRPDLSGATRVGTPVMVDPQETDAPKLAREIDSIVKSEIAKDGPGRLRLAAVGAGAAVPEGQPAPHSPRLRSTRATFRRRHPPNSTSRNRVRRAKRLQAVHGPDTKDDSKNASSSHKAKKKHHLHVPLPF